MKSAIVLTRPKHNNPALEACLLKRGWQVITQPLLKIVPLPDSEHPIIPKLSCNDVCLFISANAVRVGLPALVDRLQEQTPHVLAVGKATAAALNASGINATTPDQPDSEGLLSLPCLQNIVDAKIVIVKGVGGRELLAKTLRKRGASVIEYACYQRDTEEVNANEFFRQLRHQNRIVFQANSGETLEKLTNLLNHSDHPYLLDNPVVVPSTRVAEQARKAGWCQVIVSKNAGDDAFIAALDTLIDNKINT